MRAAQFSKWSKTYSIPNRPLPVKGTHLACCRTQISVSAGKPSLLLLDEITSSLDPALVGEITAIIKGIAHKGATMVLVGHHLDSVYEISDRVLFLKAGNQIDYGDTRDVFRGREPAVAQFLKNHVLWSRRRHDMTGGNAATGLHSNPA